MREREIATTEVYVMPEDMEGFSGEIHGVGLKVGLKLRERHSNHTTKATQTELRSRYALGPWPSCRELCETPRSSTSG